MCEEFHRAAMKYCNLFAPRLVWGVFLCFEVRGVLLGCYCSALVGEELFCICLQLYDAQKTLLYYIYSIYRGFLWSFMLFVSRGISTSFHIFSSCEGWKQEYPPSENDWNQPLGKVY